MAWKNAWRGSEYQTVIEVRLYRDHADFAVSCGICEIPLSVHTKDNIIGFIHADIPENAFQEKRYPDMDTFGGLCSIHADIRIGE